MFQVQATLDGTPLPYTFVSHQPDFHDPKHLPGYVPITSRATNGSLKPRLRGSSTEGAIYGALFLDLASRTSLAQVVNLYLRCGASDVSGFLAYADKQRRGKHREDVAAVAKTWRLR
jgi:hypothetical protein